MNTDFGRMINDKMEHARLHDVLTDFDKEQIWDELSNKLPDQKKRRVVPVWWTHAAAAAVGILIGSIAMTEILSNEDKKIVQHEPVTTVITEPQVIVKTDTVFITKEVKVPIEPVANTYKRSPKPKVVLAQQQETKEPINKEETTPATEQEKPVIEKTIIAKAPKKKVKPVHLLDIENEDRNTALYHKDPSAKLRSGFALQISAERLPANNQHPSSIFHGLKKSK